MIEWDWEWRQDHCAYKCRGWCNIQSPVKGGSTLPLSCSFSAQLALTLPTTCYGLSSTDSSLHGSPCDSPITIPPLTSDETDTCVCAQLAYHAWWRRELVWYFSMLMIIHNNCIHSTTTMEHSWSHQSPIQASSSNSTHHDAPWHAGKRYVAWSRSWWVTMWIV